MTVTPKPWAGRRPGRRLREAARRSLPGQRAEYQVRYPAGVINPRHTHPCGQTIYVTEGVGRCQRVGGPVEQIRPGDRVYFEPGEHHWHGAAPDRFMTHIAMQEVDESGSAVSWGEHVTDKEYNAARGSAG